MKLLTVEAGHRNDLAGLIVNKALNARLNNYQRRYEPVIKAALNDQDERVRRMAEHARRRLGILHG